MSVLDWTPAKRLTVAIRKRFGKAPHAGPGKEFVSLSPVEIPESLLLTLGETVLAEIHNKQGCRFFFSDSRVYLEREAGFVRIPYVTITACNWIDDTPDLVERARKKRKHGDRIIIHDQYGGRHELDDLGLAFPAMYEFFFWLMKKRGFLPKQE